MNESLIFSEPPVEPETPPTDFRRPNVLHTGVFLVLAVVIVLLATMIVLGVAIGITYLPGAKHLSIYDIAKHPSISIVAQGLGYLVTLLIASLIFREWWQRGFFEGIEWNWDGIRRFKYALLGGGLLMGLIADLASQGIKVPKNLPMDQFFQSPGAIWVVAIFGTTLGPLFEEITFRGFLYPSLETTWRWLTRGREYNALENSAESSARRNTAAIIFSTVLTSICFASIHAPQIGYTVSVLCLLFTVSVVLTLVRVVTRSVAASTLVHAGYNLWNFALMFFLTDGFRHLDKLKN